MTEVIFPAAWNWFDIGCWFGQHFELSWHDGYWGNPTRDGNPVWVVTGLGKETK